MALTQENASTTQLLKDAVDDANELVRLEVALAKDEVRTELHGVKSSAILLGVAAAMAVLALASLVASMIVALGWAFGAILGAALLVVAAILAGIGVKGLPKRPMGATRDRIETDVNRLKEHVA